MTELYKYQRKGVERINHFKGRVLLADEMGLGKSLQALTWMAENNTYPTLIVCPATLKWNWEKEVMIHLRKRVVILQGERPYQIPKSDIVIINYDIIRFWIRALKRYHFKLIIWDECHRLGSRTTQVTESASIISRRVPHIIALSGTPMTNKPAELFPILSILKRKLFPSFLPYALKYCAPRRAPWGWEYKGASNITQLHRKLKKHVMIRRRKSDVLHELPTKQRIIIPLDIVRRKEYDFAISSFLDWLKETNPEKVAKARKAEQVVKIGYVKRLAAKLKMKFVIQWIDDFLKESEDKLVVFAIHKKIIRRLKNRYKEKCTVVDGSITGRKRKLALKRFQADNTCRLFIGNIKAAGVGINLIDANTAVFIEIGWTPGEHSQAEDRIHRIGQKKISFIYYLVASGTIEEKLVSLIQKKQKTLNDTIDGKGKGDDFNIYDKLIEELKK